MWLLYFTAVLKPREGSAVTWQRNRSMMRLQRMNTPHIGVSDILYDINLNNYVCFNTLDVFSVCVVLQQKQISKENMISFIN